MLTVPEVATKFGVSQATILVWIARGELRATNVSRSARSKRPRWRISQAALEAFEAARTPSPPAPTVRRSKQPADVIQFYV